MFTYTFGFGGVSFSSDDPSTPVSSGVGVVLTVQAENIEEAKAVLASVFAPSVGAGEVELSGIIVLG
jgi:hypothetical protein